jgi:hypothetical protein
MTKNASESCIFEKAKPHDKIRVLEAKVGWSVHAHSLATTTTTICSRLLPSLIISLHEFGAMFTMLAYNCSCRSSHTHTHTHT